jgi:hypothetical protein
MLIDRGGQEAGVPCLAGPPACRRPREQLVHAWFIKNGRGSSESPSGEGGKGRVLLTLGGGDSDDQTGNGQDGYCGVKILM